MTTRRSVKGSNQTRMERAELVDAAMIAYETWHDETKPKTLRAKAEKTFRKLNDRLLCGYPEGRSIRLIPMPFRMKGYYVEMVEELILDLGASELEAAEPVRCQLARHTAQLIDDTGLSDDYRLEARDALDQVLAGLQDSAKDLVEA